jgi:hypothetical protein
MNNSQRGRPGPQERRETAHALATAVVRRDMSLADAIAARILRRGDPGSRPATVQPLKRAGGGG